MRKPLIVICGPTASGKTSVSIELARRLNGEIVSADSVQIYRHLNIGSAKPSTDELSAAKHHLIDIINPWDSFSASDFVNKSIHVIEDIQRRGKTPIICGGTGLYLHSLLYKMDFSNVEPDYDLRKELNNLSSDEIYKKLKALDCSTTLHPNDRKRIIRAIEVLSSGSQIDTFRDEEQRFCFLQICLSWNRDVLYERINQRCEEMFLNGFVEEVEKLLKNPYINTGLQSMKTIGYNQVCNYLQGDISLDNCIDEIKQKTRRYAKRQLTWFRHEKDITTINCSDYNNMSQIVDCIESSYRSLLLND